MPVFIPAQCIQPWLHACVPFDTSMQSIVDQVLVPSLDVAIEAISVIVLFKAKATP